MILSGFCSYLHSQAAQQIPVLREKETSLAALLKDYKASACSTKCPLPADGILTPSVLAAGAGEDKETLMYNTRSTS
jgi:hypothetical protein